jgi:uncharacterized protein (TIGR02246 family)
MRRFVFAGFALSLLAACQPGAAPLSDEDIAALNALKDAYVEAMLAGDAEALAALYADDATIMPADRPSVEGRAAIRDALQPVPGVTVQDLTFTSVETDGYGDLAFSRVTWSETQVVEGMEAPITLTGKSVVIFRKQEDGSWLFTVEIWNTDAPMPQPEGG